MAVLVETVKRARASRSPTSAWSTTPRAPTPCCRKLKAANLDLVFCDMVTYATSSTFGVIVRELDVPIVLVALQPLKAMDYAKATTYMQLANDDFCSVPEFTGVAIRMGKRPPPVILGTLDDDPAADAELAEWCDIAKVLHDLRGRGSGTSATCWNRCSTCTPTPRPSPPPSAATSCRPRPTTCCGSATHGDAGRDRGQEGGRSSAMFDTPDPKSDPDHRASSPTQTCRWRPAWPWRSTSSSTRSKLDGLAYYYEGEPESEMRELVTNLIVGNSLLTAAGFPMCGESDLKTCIAMLIMDRLDIGGSFAEFHPIDFKRGLRAGGPRRAAPHQHRRRQARAAQPA